MPRKKQVTSAHLREACKALGITVPVRRAEWKGGTLVLVTRIGTLRWRPEKVSAGKRPAGK